MARFEQLLVRNAAPQEERQARRQFHVAHRVRGARPDAGGIAFHPINKGRARQHAGQTGADARVERLTVLTGLLVEIQRRLNVGGGNGPPVRAASQVGEDARGARCFFGSRCWPAHEDAVAAGRWR